MAIEVEAKYCTPNVHDYDPKHTYFHTELVVVKKKLGRSKRSAVVGATRVKRS